MINKPLTATELKRHNAEYWANWSKTDEAKQADKIQTAYWQPFIKRIEQILDKKGIKHG